jgi:hypothetical protein
VPLLKSATTKLCTFGALLLCPTKEQSAKCLAWQVIATVVDSSSDLDSIAASPEVLLGPRSVAEWTTTNFAWLIWRNLCHAIPASRTVQIFAHSSKNKRKKIEGSLAVYITVFRHYIKNC